MQTEPMPKKVMQKAWQMKPKRSSNWSRNRYKLGKLDPKPPQAGQTGHRDVLDAAEVGRPGQRDALAPLDLN